MEKKNLNYDKYTNVAAEYGFDGDQWVGKKEECIKKVKVALDDIIAQSDYTIELSTGKEACLNINPSVYAGRIKGRSAGIYIAPTKGQARVVLNAEVYRMLWHLCELPACKEKNGQYHFAVNFEGLCALCECITTL